MKTTIDRLKMTAPELADKDETSLQLWIDDAYSDVQLAKFPEALEERANRYLAAFYGHLNERSGKQIQTQTVSSLSMTYFESEGNNDPYWLEYKRLLDEYTNAGGKNRVIFY